MFSIIIIIYVTIITIHKIYNILMFKQIQIRIKVKKFAQLNN